MFGDEHVVGGEHALLDALGTVVTKDVRTQLLALHWNKVEDAQEAHVLRVAVAIASGCGGTESTSPSTMEVETDVRFE